MKKFHIIIIACCFSLSITAQSLYFPPLNGDDWDTLSPSSLGWCQHRIDSMYDMLEDNNTKAFLVLKEGKIVLEKYFGTFVQDSVWYWASAGKSLTACLVGIAQQEGFLDLEDITGMYLGQGWTSCTSEQEEKITIRHQLSMSSGFNDYVPDPYCTLDTCLQYLADAGTRWAYHNAPYTLLDGVIEGATGQNLNSYFQQKVRVPTGITGIFLPSGYNNIFYSKPRSMARFGLMILNNGNWNGNQILTDTSFFNQMVNTSQPLNLSYGYLWWLNGKSSFMVPGLQFVFPGSMMPNAPGDMISALGKNGQYINVVPSQGMVVVRMGNAPDGSDIALALNDLIWEHLNGLNCGITSSVDLEKEPTELSIYPNPGSDHFSIHLPDEKFDVFVYDMNGIQVYQHSGCTDRHDVIHDFAPGVYLAKMVTDEKTCLIQKVIVGK